MEINCNYTSPHFGSIQGDATQITEKLGKRALNIIMDQKLNDVADIFVSKSGSIKVAARDGHFIRIPYNDKEIKDISIIRVSDEWMNSYAEGYTSSGETVNVGFLTASLDPAEQYKGVDKKMVAALRIADNTYEAVARKSGKSSILSASTDNLKKAVSCLLDLKI